MTILEKADIELTCIELTGPDFPAFYPVRTETSDVTTITSTSSGTDQCLLYTAPVEIARYAWSISANVVFRTIYST